MSAKDKESQEEKETISSKDEVVKDEPKVDTAAKKSTPPWSLIAVGVVASVVVVAVVVGGWLFIVHERGSDAATERVGRFGMLGGQNAPSQNGSYFGGGRYRRGAMQQAAASGVVTAVNGQTLTVAGQGKQVTVTESSSTTISGDATSVAVNDTVFVYGTTNSDGSVTATRIVIRNGAAGSSGATTPGM